MEISDDELERLGISVLRPSQQGEGVTGPDRPPAEDMTPLLAMLASESAARSAAAAQAVESLLQEALKTLAQVRSAPPGPKVESVRVTVRRDERGRIVGFDLAPRDA